MPAKDYYKILGVSPDATAEEIRKAYRRLAKEYHPDRHGGSKQAEQRFKEITEAYQVLGDPVKRKQYDRLRTAGMSGGFEGLGGLEDLFARAAGEAGARQGAGLWFEELGGLGDLFTTIFGGGSRTASRWSHQQRGRDVTTSVTIPFHMAAEGGRVDVRIPRETDCPHCGGSGAAPGARSELCPHCGGTGQILSGQGAFTVGRVCPACFGRGRVVQRQCPHCEGSGRIQTTARVEVSIPKGVQSGQKLRLRGLGEQGIAGGEPGDLYIEVQVEPHPHFERKGRDIYSKATIDMVDAALGTELDVTTLRGRVTLTVPAGIQPGQKLRIAGHGLETSDGKRGDHYVEIQVRIPKHLTEEQKRLLEQLRGAMAPAHD